MKNFLIPNKKNHYKPYLLRKIALVSYSIILITVNSFGGIFGIEQAQASTITPSNIIALTNQQRASSGLNTLNSNSKLAAAALAKANNMFEEQYWDHFGPNGETPWQFIRAAGYNYVYAGENLAKGFRTSEGVHEAWMASPTHKANIMSGNYKDIGVAVLQGVLNGQQTTLVVQMFGNLTAEVASATITPSVPSSGDAEVKVGTEQGQIKSIRIISPEESAIITDPGMQVKGDVTNITGEYTVEILDNSSVVGESEYDTDEWIFEKDSDWTEGDHSIEATVKGTDAKSDKISFTVDSTAPEVDISTISVKENEVNYEITFEVEDEWENAVLVTGDKTIDSEEKETEGNTITIFVKKDIVGEKSVLMVTDASGNMREIEISEYFPTEEVEESSKIFSLLSMDLGDKITVGIVLFIFILLCVELFVYVKNGKLIQIKEELFTVGVWWMILAVAVFNGYTGIIY